MINFRPLNSQTDAPLISVIVLNYNGARWLKRCLESLKGQTIALRLEVIVADNASPDGSDVLAEELVRGWPEARVVRHGANFGFCEGNNRAAKVAKGLFLLFLNNDTWVEPDCLEKLVGATQSSGAQVATPLMLNYDDNSVQSYGAEGFDIFGLMSLAGVPKGTCDMFVAGGCSYLIERKLFEILGGFDSRFFMYADEYDLSWRVWIAGGRAICVPESRVHHRVAANLKPAGSSPHTEIRTSDAKRFYTNRNCLLVILKNAQHVLLLTFPLQVLLLLFEAGIAWVLIRRWSFVKTAYLEALVECWRLRDHVRVERERLNRLRVRSDWAMLRFLRLRLNRWDEFKNIIRYGIPSVVRS